MLHSPTLRKFRPRNLIRVKSINPSHNIHPSCVHPIFANNVHLCKVKYIIIMHVGLSGTSYMYANFSKILLKTWCSHPKYTGSSTWMQYFENQNAFYPNFPTLLLSKSIVHPIVASIILPTNFIFRISEKSNFLNSISYVTKRWKTENFTSSVFLLCTFFQPYLDFM
mgnify:CR=1 FL=1